MSLVKLSLFDLSHHILNCNISYFKMKSLSNRIFLSFSFLGIAILTEKVNAGVSGTL